MSLKDIERRCVKDGASAEEARTIAKVCGRIGVRTMKDFERLNADIGKNKSSR
jgi:hypothetical protein